MHARKYPSLLSDRQIRWRMAQEVASFKKEVQDRLDQHEVKKKKIDDSSVCTVDESVPEKELRNNINAKCLLNHLCNTDLDEDYDKILQDFEFELPEESLESSQEISKDISNSEDGSDDNTSDFFEIIKELVYIDDKDDNED